MLPPAAQFNFAFVLAAGLPFMVAVSPKFGASIYRSRHKALLAIGLFAFGALGVVAFKIGLISRATGISCFFPLWQLPIMLGAYYLTVQLMGRTPINVIFNWQPNLIVDRLATMFILFVGFLLPILFLRNDLLGHVA